MLIVVKFWKLLLFLKHKNCISAKKALIFATVALIHFCLYTTGPLSLQAVGLINYF